MLLLQSVLLLFQLVVVVVVLLLYSMPSNRCHRTLLSGASNFPDMCAAAAVAPFAAPAVALSANRQRVRSCVLDSSLWELLRVLVATSQATNGSCLLLLLLLLPLLVLLLPLPLPLLLLPFLLQLLQMLIPLLQLQPLLLPQVCTRQLQQVEIAGSPLRHNLRRLTLQLLK